MNLKRGVVCSFGFGGQLVLAAPPNLYGNSGFFSKGAGSVEVVSLRHALRDSSEQQLLSTLIPFAYTVIFSLK